MDTTKQHLEVELARAEAVVASDNGTQKKHAPTIENHRGQIIALRKALHLLETAPPQEEKVATVNITLSWGMVAFLLSVLFVIIVL